MKLATGISETVGEVEFAVMGLVPLGKAVGRLRVGAAVTVPDVESVMRPDAVAVSLTLEARVPVRVPLPVEMPSLSVLELPREREALDDERVLFPLKTGTPVPDTLPPAPSVPVPTLVADLEPVPTPVPVPEAVRAVIEEFHPPKVDVPPIVGLLSPELARPLAPFVAEPDVSVAVSEPDGSLGLGRPACGLLVSVDSGSEV